MREAKTFTRSSPDPRAAATGVRRNVIAETDFASLGAEPS